MINTKAQDLPLAAYIYCRGTNARPGKWANSIAGQLRKTRCFCRAKKLRIEAEFIDQNESTGSDQPELKRLLDSLQSNSGHCQFVVIHCYSRIARNSDHLVAIERLLANKGVRLISTTQLTSPPKNMTELMSLVSREIDALSKTIKRKNNYQ